MQTTVDEQRCWRTASNSVRIATDVLQHNETESAESMSRRWSSDKKPNDEMQKRKRERVKMHEEIEILLEQFGRTVGRFRVLTVLFDKLIELGEVGFN